MDLGATTKKRRLTPKQQKFVDNIVSGKNPSEALRDAYPTNMTPKEISIQAQKVLKLPNVHLAIEEKRKEQQQKLIYTAEDSFRNLKFAQEKAIEQGNMNAYLKAEELKGKLLGLYTEKKDIELKGQQTIFVDKKLDE